MTASNDRLEHTERWLLSYISTVRPLFKKWNLKFKIQNSSIVVNYQHNNWLWVLEVDRTIRINLISNKDKKDFIFNITDFVINCYYEFEWDKQPMKLKNLAALCWVKISAMDEKIKTILSKSVQRHFSMIQRNERDFL